MTQASSQDNPAVVLETASRPAGSVVARLADYATLTKPGITVMVVITAFIGYAMAAGGAEAAWGWTTLVAMLAGTALSCMGAGTFNQALERDTDGRMQRTSQRPLPAGRVTLVEALVLGAVLSVGGVVILAVGANLLAAMLSAFTIVSYVLVYTPSKRIHSVSTVIGAVPGAMPPVIGYAALAQTVGLEAVLLFAIMFLWQIPHFLAIGLLYREEYARAGMPILPVVDTGGRRTHAQILACCAALLVMGVLPTLMGVSGWLAFAVGLVCGLVFLAMAGRLALEPTRARARALFLASLVYLPLVLAVILIDQK